MKLTRKEKGLPPELCTKAARAAFNYAGEDPDVEHVRWLGTNDEHADGFTRHDFADLFGVNEVEPEHDFHVVDLQSGVTTEPGIRIFQALGRLKDGRIALVEAVTRGEWVSSSGVAKVTKLIVQMGDYLALSERTAVKHDPVHRGRVKLCESLRLRLETSTIRAAAQEADAAFDEIEKTIG